MRRLLPALVLGAVALGAAGCNEYHYYDIRVAYDGATVQPQHDLPGPELPRVRDRRRHGRLLPGRALHERHPATTNIGVFEFATFADSGTLNFMIRTYVGGRVRQLSVRQRDEVDPGHLGDRPPRTTRTARPTT